MFYPTPAEIVYPVGNNVASSFVTGEADNTGNRNHRSRSGVTQTNAIACFPQDSFFS
jgi:hypothetical protein